MDNGNRKLEAVLAKLEDNVTRTERSLETDRSLLADSTNMPSRARTMGVTKTSIKQKEHYLKGLRHQLADVRLIMESTII
ncbi:hypothetical protein J4N45_10590 [Vibrio sp. SCSIO 43140]|uniref:hypothetical protein n=1 Tax=Vibrio sp. SCSIO 43140 TaxID=2819100 RepID=UPI0020757B51|nr:hypothetical protein [Vibrio sp. SCSIO 43140]USD58978.1 hypothetical protein J4N45_10590 [Vibrio sp. SCSIO 43140]